MIFDGKPNLPWGHYEYKSLKTIYELRGRKNLGFAIFSEKNRLSELCDLHGSDKGSRHVKSPYYKHKPHTYCDLYHLLFSISRKSVNLVFECGIGTNNTKIASNMAATGRPGASLRVWRDYFPNAMVYGADIDREILFQEDRIATGYMDQTNARSVLDFFSAIEKNDFNIMIDDGLHEFNAFKCLFENSIERLHPDGFYLVEDIDFEKMYLYRDFLHSKEYDFDIFFLEHSEFQKHDNNILVIQKSSEQV